ncbi:hypothetical protein KR084_009558 [Drosophila pseudotakahashii]|nr:hypothetical protein KR084_009558 [Drosophila pseudotakahashii]
MLSTLESISVVASRGSAQGPRDRQFRSRCSADVSAYTYSVAYAQSGSANQDGKPLSESCKLNEQLMNTLDWTDVECLREASSKHLWAATPDTWLHFPVDLPQAQEANASGSRHEIDL